MTKNMRKLLTALRNKISGLQCILDEFNICEYKDCDLTADTACEACGRHVCGEHSRGCEDCDLCTECIDEFAKSGEAVQL